MSRYVATRDRRHHLSVGAIVESQHGILVLRRADGVYGFVTGTLEDNESLERCLRRELLKEAGATVRSPTYAGSTISHRTHTGQLWAFEKTTLWFRCRLVRMDPPTEPIDPEEGEPMLAEAGFVLTMPPQLRHPSRWPGGLL